ncbi:MAG: hypothetical protein KA066_02775, partial [Candidatus Pacebacteria bacterium]|nr:hypothetical protein [Candidatus Paceibacterota bacterium]
AYIGGLFYHSDNITEATSGAYMARMGYVSAAVDGSANETFYINGRPVASGSNREVGKAHGNETRTEEPELLVDGVAYRMSGNTATRARASNVVTVETSLPHGLTTGDVVTMSGFASTTYSAHEVAVTVADSTTFTYSDSGTNETEVADTTGRFIRKGIKLGSSSVQLSQASELFHQDYLSGNTPIGDLTTTYTLSDKIFATQAAGTIDIDFRHAGSFGILASYWSGDPSTKGPVYPGAATAKAHVPEQAETTLVSNDGSHALGGQSLTFALSRPESDLAHIAEISSFTGNASFSGSWDTFVEDRSDGNVEKLYLKLPDAGTVDVPAGWSFEYGSNRIDGLAPEAEDSGIFVD